MRWITAGTWCVVWIGGCAANEGLPPEKTLSSSNKAYPLDQLFTDANGCKVYRFYDKGEFRYYVVGPSGAQMLPTTKVVSETVVETVQVDSGGGGHGHKH